MNRWCISGAILALSAIFASGCAHHAPAAKPAPQVARATPSPLFESSAPMAQTAQQRAQHAWCDYLETLYRRSSPSGAPWDQLGACKAHLTTASPELLERTVACSRSALQGFSGDPLTEAYAAEVRRCGAGAIAALTLPPAQIEPYLALVCERAAACGGKSSAVECASDVSARYGAKLGRVIGIINEEGRSEVRRCLRTAACQDVGDQIASCVDPVLDRLLWTPD
jgi:hypothetical protein